MNEQNISSEFEIESSSTEPTHCPYCQAEIYDADAIVQCVTCESIYHESCWQEIDRCAMYGCEGSESQAVSDLSNIPVVTEPVNNSYSEAAVDVVPDFSIDYSDLYAMQSTQIQIDEYDLGPALNCSYCHVEVQAGEVTVACAKCNAAHHRDCWGERNRCAVHGCRHRRYVEHFAMGPSANGSSETYPEKSYPVFWDEGWWSNIKKFWNSWMSEW